MYWTFLNIFSIYVHFCIKRRLEFSTLIKTCIWAEFNKFLLVMGNLGLSWIKWLTHNSELDLNSAWLFLWAVVMKSTYIYMYFYLYRAVFVERDWLLWFQLILIMKLFSRNNLCNSGVVFKFSPLHQDILLPVFNFKWGVSWYMYYTLLMCLRIDFWLIRIG